MSPYYLEKKRRNRENKHANFYEVKSIHENKPNASRELRRLEMEILNRPKYRIVFRAESCSECGKKGTHAFKLDELGLCVLCAKKLRRDYNTAYMNLSGHRGIIAFVPKK